MMERIPERDWKILRDMKDEVLSQACDRILDQAQQIIDHRGGRPHAAYLELWQLIEAEDSQISLMFDGLKRSNALSKLAMWRASGLVTNEAFAQFSEPTRQATDFIGGHPS
jgi:hypothetical protein